MPTSTTSPSTNPSQNEFQNPFSNRFGARAAARASVRPFSVRPFLSPTFFARRVPRACRGTRLEPRSTGSARSIAAPGHGCHLDEDGCHRERIHPQPTRTALLLRASDAFPNDAIHIDAFGNDAIDIDAIQINSLRNDSGRFKSIDIDSMHTNAFSNSHYAIYAPAINLTLK